MATHLRESTSIETIADVCDAIAAGLESDPATSHLAGSWCRLTEKADGLVAEKRKLDRNSRRARARLAVADARWDSEVAAFGRAVVDASSGNRSVLPYTRFFNKTPPSDAREVGYEREVALGRQWIAELNRNPEEPLAKTFLPRLEAATQTLQRALDDRTAAVAAYEKHRTSVVLLRDAVNRELDVTEGELLRLFPGARARVASYLSATRPQREDKEPAPQVPADAG